MAFDISNVVIDRIVRGIATSQGENKKLGIKKGDILFSINQIQNASLNCTSESADAVDALGTPIATFYRSKAAEFSAENALFDMALLATQSGTVKKVASEAAKIETPCFQTIDIVAKTTGYDLSHTPIDGTLKIYALKGDGTLGEKIEMVTDAAAAGRKVVISGTKITVDEKGFVEGEQLFCMYEYLADGAENNGAVEVLNTATNFPVGCKFIMEVLCADVCDQTNLIYAYLVFPNAKLSPDFDWSIATDSTHPFSMRAMQEYCDKEKKLFSIVIPE